MIKKSKLEREYKNLKNSYLAVVADFKDLNRQYNNLFQDYAKATSMADKNKIYQLLAFISMIANIILLLLFIK